MRNGNSQGEAIPGQALSQPGDYRALHLEPFPRLASLAIRDDFLSGRITGNSTAPVPVWILIDGEKAGKALADPTAESELGDEPPGEGMVLSFCFPLPQKIRDGFPHQLTAILEGTSPPDDLEPHLLLRYVHGNLFGRVGVEGELLTGWVASRVPWPAPPVVEILDKDRALVRHARSVAISPEDEVHRAGGVCMARFSFAVAEMAPQKIHLVVGQYELSGSPLAAADFYEIKGMIHEITEDFLSGWALNRKRLSETIDLALHVDGERRQLFRPNAHNLSVLDKLRIGKEKAGLFSFRIPLPPLLRDGEEHLVEIVAIATGERLHGSRTVRFPVLFLSPEDLGLPAPATSVRPWRRCPPAPPNPGHAPLVSVIVLNRNGAALLENLLLSWQECNTFPHYEFIIVDHNSTDDSSAVLKRWAGILPLKIIPLPSNDSFSASCNRGAAMAQGETLLFLNNDIVWIQDALPHLLATLSEASVGAVGLKLLFLQAEEGRGQGRHAAQVQHMGIAFGLFGNKYWPFEIRPGHGAPAQSFLAEQVPGVTGAVLLCRKTEFVDLGGFSEEYFYGFEDVEFCLRLSGTLGKKIVCRNDLLALHHHGYTRLTGREKEVLSQLPRNEAVLQRDVGLYLKRAFVHGFFHDQPLSNEKLTVGFVVGAPARIEATSSPLATARRIVAQWLAEGRPVQPLFLASPHGWHTASPLHVLVAMHPCFDLRLLAEARADLLRLAWVEDASLDQWDNNASLAEFDFFLTTGPVSQAILSERFGPARVFPLPAHAPAAAGGAPIPGPSVCDLLLVADQASVCGEIRQELSSLPLDRTVTILGQGWEIFFPALPFWQGEPSLQRLGAAIGASRVVLYSEQLPALIQHRVRAVARALHRPAVATDTLQPCNLSLLLEQERQAAIGRKAEPPPAGPGGQGELPCLGACFYNTLKNLLPNLVRIAIRPGISRHLLPYSPLLGSIAETLSTELRRAGCVVWLECRDDGASPGRVADVVISCARAALPPAESGAMNIGLLLDQAASPASSRATGEYALLLCCLPLLPDRSLAEEGYSSPPIFPGQAGGKPETGEVSVYIDPPQAGSSFHSGEEDGRPAYYLLDEVLYHGGEVTLAASALRRWSQAGKIVVRIPEDRGAGDLLPLLFREALRNGSEVVASTHAGTLLPPVAAPPAATGNGIARLLEQIKPYLEQHGRHPFCTP